MAKKLTELEEDRDAGKTGAHERLKSFREKRILLADSIVQVSYRLSSISCCNKLDIQSCADFDKWAAKEVMAQVRKSQERRAQRREA